jgi:hypothetical protein
MRRACGGARAETPLSSEVRPWRPHQVERNPALPEAPQLRQHLRTARHRLADEVSLG